MTTVPIKTALKNKMKTHNQPLFSFINSKLLEKLPSTKSLNNIPANEMYKILNRIQIPSNKVVGTNNNRTIKNFKISQEDCEKMFLKLQQEKNIELDNGFSSFLKQIKEIKTRTDIAKAITSKSSENYQDIIINIMKDYIKIPQIKKLGVVADELNVYYKLFKALGLAIAALKYFKDIEDYETQKIIEKIIHILEEESKYGGGTKRRKSVKNKK